MALAVELKDLQSVVKLLSMGAHVDVRDWEIDRTPLLTAIHNAWTDGVDVLLNAKADPLATDANGFTALHACTVDYDHGHDFSIFKRLIKAGVNVDAANLQGFSALTYLGQKKACVEVIKHLLDAGADPRGALSSKRQCLCIRR